MILCGNTFLNAMANPDLAGNREIFLMLGMFAWFAVRPIGAAVPAGPSPQACRHIKALEGAPPGTSPSEPGDDGADAHGPWREHTPHRLPRPRKVNCSIVLRPGNTHARSR
jgi:hypothetical protein